MNFLNIPFGCCFIVKRKSRNIYVTAFYKEKRIYALIDKGTLV